MKKVGIKGVRTLKTEAFDQQPFLLCSDGKPVALIVPTGNLGEEELLTRKPIQVETQVKIPKVKIPLP